MDLGSKLLYFFGLWCDLGESFFIGSVDLREVSCKPVRCKMAFNLTSAFLSAHDQCSEDFPAFCSKLSCHLRD